MWDDGETGSVDPTVELAGRTLRPKREGMREQGQHTERSSVGRGRESRDAGRAFGSRFGVT